MIFICKELLDWKELDIRLEGAGNVGKNKLELIASCLVSSKHLKWQVSHNQIRSSYDPQKYY